MTQTGKPVLRGLALALLAFATFATHDVVVKYLGSHYSTFQILFFSMLLSFPLATIMLIRDPVSGHLRPVHPWWTLLRTGAAVIGGLSAFYAFTVLPMTQVYAILFATPLLITILSIPVLGERVGRHRWFAVVAGLIGVLIVLQPGATPLELGHLAALTAAVGGATANVTVRKIGKDERSAVLMLYPMLTSFAVNGAILPTVYQPMPLLHLGLMGVISFLGFCAGLALIAAYKRADAALVAPMQYSQIIWASVFGYFLFAEFPDTPTFLGAAVIIASGLYIVIRESTAGISENRPVISRRSFAESAAATRAGNLLRRRQM
jgi:S-adenosylmethionine uptake transporter